MIKYFVITILFLIQIKIFGQDKTLDSLKHILITAKHDSVKIKVLAEIGELCELEDILKYAEPCVKLCQAGLVANKNQRAFYLKYLAPSYHNIAISAQLQSDLPKAMLYYNKCLIIQQETKDLVGVANSLNNIGLIYKKQGNLVKALSFYEKSMNLFEDLKDRNGIAGNLNDIGRIYDNLGDVIKALDFYHRSLKLNEEMNDKFGMALSYNNIGNIYLNQGEIKKALEYNLKSLKIYNENNDKAGASIQLNNIGSIYLKLGDTLNALDYAIKSLNVCEQIQDKAGIAYSLSNIGAIYYEKGNIPKSLDFQIRSLKIREEINDKQGVSASLYNIASILLKQGKLNDAFTNAQRSLIIAKELGYPENIEQSANVLKFIHQKQNNFKEAFKMYELEIKMRDSISNQETQKVAVKKQMQYTYEKKAALDSTEHAKENDIKNSEIKARKAEIKVKENTQYALYVGLALVLVFAGFMYNRFKITQKQKHIIEIKEKETQHQKHIIEEKHKEITDSINYAERIQRSFIATKEILDEHLNDYFVLFKPKDVVSGDFYWASKLNNGKFAFVTADSTGHGVPGAIMSLLNITSLEKAIETLTEPAEILNSTRKTIIERLKKDGSEHGGKDGMDCSLTVYDFRNKKLIVAAANNPVWIARKVVISSSDEGAYREVNNMSSSRYENSKETEFSTRTDKVDVIEIKPDKMPVGKHDRDAVSFTQQEFDLQSGDVIYTLTDGFPDQFGGEKGKKFMSKNLRELLATNAHLPMQEQKALLEQTFADWVGNLEQVDDVCLIGVRI